ncbi:metal-dependent hydrolase [Spongiibacter sp. KMU-158]|uniref:Metal-dependent hydrolase n=1 Tax=Spongiibacter pelagi TaxID=2760804 RepID=A0A927C2S0_9GAMM|nr:metal-dependent hydrolase [Spongiibacter pelagi]MBD2858566.1 metal-dependent hydrolase [Spongiibacter pelagi]
MTIQITPVHRNLEFNLPKDRIADWHPAGVQTSHFFNAMSLFFPDGERFFIDSVRHYRDGIDDPELKAQVRGFIGQEAMHGREHEEYNEALAERGMPVARYLKIINGLLGFTQKFVPKRMQLSTTIALEHLTAILANSLLQKEAVLAGTEERFGAIWHWHALEETEHKAVAYDVYQRTFGKTLFGYIDRCQALIVATFLFWFLCIPIHIDLVRREGKLFDLKGWGRCFSFLWIKPGALVIALKEWFDYFKPGFHPWDHNNRRFLDNVDDLVKQVENYKVAQA